MIFVCYQITQALIEEIVCDEISIWILQRYKRFVVLVSKLPFNMYAIYIRNLSRAFGPTVVSLCVLDETIIFK